MTRGLRLSSPSGPVLILAPSWVERGLGGHNHGGNLTRYATTNHIASAGLPLATTGPEEHDPRNDVLTSAKRAEELKHRCHLRGNRVYLSPFALETMGGHGASTLASVYHRYLLFTRQMRDSALPADVLMNKFNKEISFARRGTIAQVTKTPPPPSPRRLTPALANAYALLRLATPAQCALVLRG